MLQANIRLAIKLANRITLRELRNRTRRFIPNYSGHAVAKVVGAVIPPSIRTMCKKEMVHEPVVETVIERINQELAICQQNHALICPTKIQDPSRVLNLIYLGENLIIRHGCLGDLHQNFIFPNLSRVFIPVLHHLPATNNENHGKDWNREPNDNLAANRSMLMVICHLAEQTLGRCLCTALCIAVFASAFIGMN